MPAGQYEQLIGVLVGEEDQLPSTLLLMRDTTVPVKPVRQAHVYSDALAVDTAGETAVLAYAASGGCESANTSIADSALL